MNVLLFGANGQVGSACCETLTGAGFHLIPLTRLDADFSKPYSVYDAVIAYKPDIVVNACAYTAVDKAESEPELAQLVNGDSVGAMAKACAELNIPLIHLSTDYVYAGDAGIAYVEDDPVAPSGVYGATKLEGEKQLTTVHSQHIILRTSWVFGEQGNNFVKIMLRLGRERAELGVVADQFGCPTFAGDIAKVITQLVALYQQSKILPWGIYHCSSSGDDGSGQCSWYEFAQAVFLQAEKAKLLAKLPKVNPITTAQYPTPAKRPANSIMNTQKLTSLLNQPMPHWQLGLVKMMKGMTNI